MKLNMNWKDQVDTRSDEDLRMPPKERDLRSKEGLTPKEGASNKVGWEE